MLILDTMLVVHSCTTFMWGKQIVWRQSRLMGTEGRGCVKGFLPSLTRCPNTPSEGFWSSLGDTIWASAAGSGYISETWGIELAGPCCFLAVCSNGFTSANKEAGQSPATLSFSPMCGFIRALYCFWRRLYVQNDLGSCNCHSPFRHHPPQPPPLVECSVPSPSQVEMMYDLCCQLPSRVRAELIMTRSSLLCQHHTPFCCSPCSYFLDVTCVYGCVKEWAGCFFSRLLPCTHTSPHPLPNNKDQYKTQSLTCKWLS